MAQVIYSWTGVEGYLVDLWSKVKLKLQLWYLSAATETLKIEPILKQPV
jgi:hypothetical protein